MIKGFIVDNSHRNLCCITGLVYEEKEHKNKIININTQGGDGDRVIALNIRRESIKFETRVSNTDSPHSLTTCSATIQSCDSTKQGDLQLIYLFIQNLV